MARPVCPKCGRGEDMWGHEVQGVYDGVLFWVCAACSRAFARGWKSERLATLSADYAREWNAHNGPTSVI